MRSSKFYKSAFYIILTLVIFIVYSPVLKYGFTNWDDDELVIENPDIKELDINTVKNAFSKVYIGMYEPFAILFIATEYQLYNLDPYFYHLSRLLLHLVACIFVYLIILKILKSFYAAILITLIFAIHPTQGEGFIWIGAINTILSNVFILAGLYVYVLYILKNKKRYTYFYFTIMLFLFAVFTKASAVIFPVLLFGFDYITKRKITRKVILEKIPFIVISILIALVTIKTRPVENIGKSIEYQLSNFDRFSLISYSLWHYISNSIFPINLSPYHAYPFIGENNIPTVFYLSTIFIILSAIPFFIKKYISREIIFGAFFFLCPLMLILPYKLIMKYVVADRYLYLPMVGIFICIVSWALAFLKKKPQYKKHFLIGYIIIIGFYIYKTTDYIKIWKNSETLWSYIISKNQNIADAWLNRGVDRLEKNNISGSLHDLNQSIKLNSQNFMTFANRGLVFARQKKYDLAIKDFSESIKLNPDYAKTWSNRGNAYHKQQKYSLALLDLNKAISMDSIIAEAFFNRGNVIADMGDIHAAIPEYTKAIMLNPDYKEAWFIRGMAKIRTSKKDSGCSDLLKAEQLGYTWARKKYNDFCK